MANKPDLLKWVGDDDAAKIATPSDTKKLNGFLYKEKPAFQYVNYLFNRISKWFRGLQGQYYDIVVGSSSQVTAGDAINVIADLNDTLVVAGSRVLFLDGTHTVATATTLNNGNCVFDCETPNAIIACNANLNLDGAMCRGSLYSSGGPLHGINVGSDSSFITVNGQLCGGLVPLGRLTLADVSFTGGTPPTHTIGGIITKGSVGATLAPGVSAEIDIDTGLVGNVAPNIFLLGIWAKDSSGNTVHGAWEAQWIGADSAPSSAGHLIGPEVTTFSQNTITKPVSAKIKIKLTNRHGSITSLISANWMAIYVGIS
jgi:hypothetical protein